MKLMMDLFDVESSSEEETKIFQNVSHEELLTALECWIDQCKMILGDVVLIENFQGFKDAGVDLGISLVQSKLRFGIQVKSFGDIKKEDFYTKLKAQAFESDSHNLDKYIILFAGDMNIQKLKVGGMISELSQRNKDLRIITVAPEKLLTILKAYRNKIHPMKLVMLDILNATRIVNGVADNLSNQKRDVEITINIKNLERDGADRPHSFKLKYSFNKSEIDKAKIQDELDHMKITDDVLRMKKSDFNDLIVSGEKEDAQPDEILIYNEKPNRVYMQLQALSSDSKLISEYSQLVDVFRENDILKFAGKDTKKPLKFGIQVDLTMGAWKFDFNQQYKGYSINDLYEMHLFLILLRNAIFIRLFIGQDNVSQILPLKEPIDFQPSSSLIDLVSKLKKLQELSGLELLFEFSSEQEIRELPGLVTIAINMFINHKICPRDLSTLTMTLPKEAVLKILHLYKKEKTNENILINLPFNILGQQIVIPNVKLYLADFRPLNGINPVDTIEQGNELEYEITLEARKQE